MDGGVVAVLFVVLLVGFLSFGQGGSNYSQSRVIHSRPAYVVLIPRSDIYFVPGYSYDLFYSGGYWWSYRSSIWYRSEIYDGPWVVIQNNYVPSTLINLPRDYRNIYKGEKQIEYKQWEDQRNNQNKQDQYNKEQILKDRDRQEQNRQDNIRQDQDNKNEQIKEEKKKAAEKKAKAKINPWKKKTY